VPINPDLSAVFLQLLPHRRRPLSQPPDLLFEEKGKNNKPDPRTDLDKKIT
jgi:hypothetical protein